MFQSWNMLIHGDKRHRDAEKNRCRSRTKRKKSGRGGAIQEADGFICDLNDSPSATDSYLTTQKRGMKTRETAASRERRQIEDRGKILAHSNTESYSLMHYSQISLQNAAEDVPVHEHYSVMTWSITGQTSVCVCVWGVKPADGEGAALYESDGGQVDCAVCYNSLFFSVETRLVKFRACYSKHIILYVWVYVFPFLLPIGDIDIDLTGTSDPQKKNTGPNAAKHCIIWVAWRAWRASMTFDPVFTPNN